MTAVPPRARLGTGELAAMLGASREWVARQCAAGAFPCMVVAGRYRFTPEDVAAIVARCRHPSRAPRPARLTFGPLPEKAVRVYPTDRRPAIDWRHYPRVSDR